MAEQWYIRARGQVTGPFDWAYLELLVRRQRLGRLDELSTDRRHWKLASAHTQLFPSRSVKKSRAEMEAESQSEFEIHLDSPALPTPAPASRNSINESVRQATPTETTAESEMGRLPPNYPRAAMSSRLAKTVIATVAASVLVFVCVAALVIPKLMRPSANSSVIAAASPNETGSPSNASQPAMAQSPGSNANGNRPPGSSNAQTTNGTKPTAKRKGTGSNSTAGITPTKPAAKSNPKPVAKPVPPPVVQPKPNPFSALANDETDPKLGVLDLFGPAPTEWTIALDDPTTLKLEILGTDIIQRGQAARYEINSTPDTKSAVWTLSLKTTDEANELGEFRYGGESGQQKLSFTWRDAAKSNPEDLEPLKYLAIGLSAGSQSRLCRMGMTKPRNLLASPFNDPKVSESEVAIDIDPLLAARLQVSDSPLRIDLDLVGDVTDFLAGNQDILHGLKPASRQSLPLTASTNLQADHQWAVFKDDPQLAVLEIEPRVSNRVLTIHLAAFATVALFKESDFKIRSDLPTPEKSRIPLAAEPLRRRLNEKVAKNIVKSLDALKKPERDRPHGDVNGLAGLPGSVPGDLTGTARTASDQDRYRLRHQPEAFKWLWETLSGGANGALSNKSIRGALAGAKIGLKLTYPCHFNGVDYSVAVFQASK